MSRYRIERLIGVGGLGMVYEARWLLPFGESMPVACKVVRDDRRDIPHYREFMRQEAAISMRLSHNHPNLVTVFNFFEDERGRLCLAMELVQGGSVADLLDAYHRLPTTVVRRIAKKVLSALACLHDAQVLHRDLSPCNILVSTAGEVKLSDLNLVKLMDQGQAHTHTFRGKPVFASPEARENRPLDARSDLYSFGVILYFMLAGKPPWGDERDPDRIKECSKREAFAPLLGGTPRDLAALAMGLLRSDPDARKPQSAHEALAILRRSDAPVAGRADLGGLVTAVIQRRGAERRAGAVAKEERLEVLKPGDLLVARALDNTEPMVHEADGAVSDARPERGVSSATTEEYAHSAALVQPARRGTRTVDSVSPFPDRWAGGRSRRGRVARFAALLVAVMGASAAVGVLVYKRLPANIESARLSTAPQQPPTPMLPVQPQEAPAEPPTREHERRIADAIAPDPTLVHEAVQREPSARQERDRHRKTRRRADPQDHVVPRALPPRPR